MFSRIIPESNGEGGIPTSPAVFSISIVGSPPVFHRAHICVPPSPLSTYPGQWSFWLYKRSGWICTALVSAASVLYVSLEDTSENRTKNPEKQ